MKKVLIITYYWPPAGGPGVQRIVKYVKHLPSYGWEPLILTVRNPTSPAYDQSLLKNLPSTLKVFKTGTYEPFNLYRKITRQAQSTILAKDVIIKKPNEDKIEKIARIIRANLFLPDARVGWLPKMLKEGREIVRTYQPLVIFSTSPPHSLQLGAKKLAKQTGLKWIADLRDPWTEAYWESGIERLAMISRLNHRMEKRVLQDADLISTVSEGFRDLFLQKANNRCEILYHGFEQMNTKKQMTDRFSIHYLGTMSSYQSPDVLFNTLNKLDDHIKDQIELVVTGKVFSGFDELCSEYPELRVTVRDFIPYGQVMEESTQASILLMINPRPTYGASLIPAKIYDYISLCKPIIAFGIKHGRLEQLLEETGRGKLFESGDEEKIEKFILYYFKLWQKQRFILLEPNQRLEKYKASHNVERLAGLLDELSK